MDSHQQQRDTSVSSEEGEEMKRIIEGCVKCDTELVMVNLGRFLLPTCDNVKCDRYGLATLKVSLARNRNCLHIRRKDAPCICEGKS